MEETKCCATCGWKDTYMCDACIEEAMAGNEYSCYATDEELAKKNIHPQKIES